MNQDALAVGLASLVGAAVYLYLGVRLARRPVPEMMRVPAAQFALFWIGLSASTALSGTLSLLASFSSPPLGVVVAFLYYNVLVVCAALWGLTCYLLFLYRGRSVLLPVSLLYVVEYALLVYYVAAGQPTGVTVTAGSVGPHESVTITGPLVVIPVLLLVLPEFIAAIAYFSLYFRTKDPTVRYRVTLVSWGLIGWFLIDFLGSSLSGGSLVGLGLTQFFLVVAALVVLMAYYPPRLIRSRFGVTGI